MKRLITLFLTLLLLVGCSSSKLLDKKTYEGYSYISINMYNDANETHEFWFAIDEKGNVIDGATPGWIIEFDASVYKGNYLKAFDDIYSNFNGDSYANISFGFANMQEEKKYRDECQKYINNLRPDVDFVIVYEEFDRVYYFFENYQNNLLKNGQDKNNENQNQPSNQPDTVDWDKVKNSQDFINALTKSEGIILKQDINVDLSSISVGDIIVKYIDCDNHSLSLSGVYAVSDNCTTIEVENASNIDISNLNIDTNKLSSINEKIGLNQFKNIDWFRFYTNYKNANFGSFPERRQASGNPIITETYVDIDNEGTCVTLTSRIAQSIEARCEQETEYLYDYMLNPDKYRENDRDLRLKIYTDVELYLDDFDSPTDQEIGIEVADTGSLKLSGKINICGPKVCINSIKKGSVDISELEIVRKCMSPDCMWIFCDEGHDEEKLTPIMNDNIKTVITYSENQCAITIWSRTE